MLFMTFPRSVNYTTRQGNRDLGLLDFRFLSGYGVPFEGFIHSNMQVQCEKYEFAELQSGPI